jgi:hypothetical protein
MNKQLTYSEGAVKIGADSTFGNTVPPIKEPSPFLKAMFVGLLAVIAYKVLS